MEKYVDEDSHQRSCDAYVDDPAGTSHVPPVSTAPIVFGHTMNPHPTLEKAPTLDPAAPDPAPPASDPAACAALLQKLGFNPNGDLCKRVPRPSKTNPFNQTTAMYEAANVGDLGLCRFIFEQSERRKIALGTKQGGANAIVTKSNRRSSPFHVACLRGHLAVAQWLFKTSVDAGLINLDFFEGPGGRTPMHLASDNAHLDVMKWLFEAGCAEDIHAKDSLGWTPVDYAISQGHIAVVRWLETVGARVFKTPHVLLFICQKGRMDVAQWIFATFGAEDIRARYKDDMTLMHHACSNGHLDVAKLLFDFGAAGDIRAQNNRGITPMLVACTHGHLDVARCLFKVGATNGIFTKIKFGVLPMYNACVHGHFAVAKWCRSVLTYHALEANPSASCYWLPRSYSVASPKRRGAQ